MPTTPNQTLVRTKSLRPDGHYRAGRKHPARTFADWPAETFTAAQLEQLRADPDLEVIVSEPPSAPAGRPASREST